MSLSFSTRGGIAQRSGRIEGRGRRGRGPKARAPAGSLWSLWDFPSVLAPGSSQGGAASDQISRASDQISRLDKTDGGEGETALVY